jgi:hypothetical protein
VQGAQGRLRASPLSPPLLPEARLEQRHGAQHRRQRALRQAEVGGEAEAGQRGQRAPAQQRLVPHRVAQLRLQLLQRGAGRQLAHRVARQLDAGQAAEGGEEAAAR